MTFHTLVIKRTDYQNFIWFQAIYRAIYILSNKNKETESFVFTTTKACLKEVGKQRQEVITI